MIWIWAKCYLWAKDNNAEMIAPNWTKIHPRRLVTFDSDQRLYFRYFTNAGYIKGFEKIRLLLLGFRMTPEEYVALTSPQKNLCIIEFSGLGEFAPLIGRHEEVRRELYRIINRGYLPEPAPIKPFIGIHVRLGDFIVTKYTDELKAGMSNTRIPLDWYIQALRKLRKTIGKRPARIFSDGEPAELELLLHEPMTEYVKKSAALTDLLKLAQSSTLIASRSSFSLWAAYFGQMPVVYFPGARPVSKNVVSVKREVCMETEWEPSESMESAFCNEVRRMFGLA